MIRCALPAAVLLVMLAQTASAQNCKLSNNYCVPFVACTLDGGKFFFGKTYGRRNGPVFAKSISGVECEGTLKRTAIGAGTTSFMCSDGESGRGSFTYFDSKTGTARGRGRTKSGDRLRFWAGHNVLEFVLGGAETDLELIGCVRRAMDAGK